MTKWLILISAVCLYLSWGKLKHRILPAKEIKNLTAKSSPTAPARKIACTQSKCTLIYVAPWCGACNQMQPHMKKLLEASLKSNDLGVKVIVGQGSERDNEEKAREYENPDHVFIDDDSAIKENLGVEHYPTIYVTGADGKIEMVDQEAWYWAHQKLLPQGMGQP